MVLLFIDARIVFMVVASRGFVYVVLTMGVTGVWLFVGGVV